MCCFWWGAYVNESKEKQGKTFAEQLARDCNENKKKFVASCHKIGQWTRKMTSSLSQDEYVKGQRERVHECLILERSWSSLLLCWIWTIKKWGLMWDLSLLWALFVRRPAGSFLSDLQHQTHLCLRKLQDVWARIYAFEEESSCLIWFTSMTFYEHLLRLLT